MRTNLIGNEARFIMCLLSTLLSGFSSDMLLKQILKSDKIPETALVSVAATAVFICVHGFSTKFFVCASVFQVLMFASVYDIKTYTVPNYVHLLIVSAGLLRFQPLPSFLGLILVALPFILAFLLMENKVGVGDIKLMGAYGFVMGVRAGYTALIFGLAAAVLLNVLRHKKNKPFPLVPYLAFGCFMGLIQM